MKKSALFVIDEELHSLLDARYGRHKSAMVNQLIKDHLFGDANNLRQQLTNVNKQLDMLTYEKEKIHMQMLEQEKAEEVILKKIMPGVKKALQRPPIPDERTVYLLEKQGIVRTHQWLYDHWEDY